MDALADKFTVIQNKDQIGLTDTCCTLLDEESGTQPDIYYFRQFPDIR